MELALLIESKGRKKAFAPPIPSDTLRAAFRFQKI